MLCCSFCLLVQNGDLDVHPKAPQQLNILQINGSMESSSVTGNSFYLLAKRHAMMGVDDLDSPNCFAAVIGHRHTQHLVGAESCAFIYGWIKSAVCITTKPRVQSQKMKKVRASGHGTRSSSHMSRVV